MEDTEDIPADAAVPFTKRARRTAAAQNDSSVGVLQHAASDDAAADLAPDNEKAFRRLRKASKKNLAAESAPEEQTAEEEAVAVTGGEAAVPVAKPGSSAEAQQVPAASAARIAGPAVATAHGEQDGAAVREAAAPAAGAEGRQKPRKGQPQTAAQEVAGADDPAVEVSAAGPLPCH